MGRDHEEKFNYFGHFSKYPSALQLGPQFWGTARGCSLKKILSGNEWRMLVWVSVLSCEKSKRLTPLFGGRHPPSLCLPVSGWNDEWPGETQNGDIIELIGCLATLPKERKLKIAIEAKIHQPIPKRWHVFWSLSSGDRGNRSCLFNCSRKHLQ